jgi:hypothetical protein
VQIEQLRITDTYEQYALHLSSTFPMKTVANDVQVFVPLPCDSFEVKPDPDYGKAVH